VQSQRNKQAAKKLFRTLLKGLTSVPRVIITDKRKSYGAAKREMLPGVEYRQSRCSTLTARLLSIRPHVPLMIASFLLGLSSWHKRSSLSPEICDTLSPGNAMVALPILQGSFMSPMRAALSARVSTHDQPTLTMQIDALREFATWRHWPVTDAGEEIASGATDHRPKRQTLLKAAKQRQLDAMLAWKLDRWRRSLIDFTTTLHERTAFGVGFVSLTEAFDLTTPAGRAFVGFLTVFAELEREVIRERIKAGIADARTRGEAHGRPRVKVKDAAQMRALAQQGLRQAAMARPWDSWRTSVRRVLMQQEGT